MFAFVQILVILSSLTVVILGLINIHYLKVNNFVAATKITFSQTEKNP